MELEELVPRSSVEDSHTGEMAVEALEIEALLAQAREEGRLAGIEEGRQSEAERFKRAAESVKGLVSGIESAAAAREREARARIVVLATAIATHLLAREVRASPEIISDLTRRAIAEFRSRALSRPPAGLW
jgi:flagellar biosynthesis/type III secretory pathway protein FliH